MSIRRVLFAVGMAGCLTVSGVSLSAADPTIEQTARYILDVVRAFRAAYVLHVVEHTRGSGLEPKEEWQKDPHFLPLPAQFVKSATEQVDSVEIGLISLTPINPENRPKTQAETDALIQLEKDRARGFISFSDGSYFKGVSADLAMVRSCIECHNHHPKTARSNFKQWDVMGGLVVRIKRGAELETQPFPPDPTKRPPGPMDWPVPQQQPVAPPWVR